MVELGELQKQHAEFAKRKIRIVAVSNDVVKVAKETQADFPDLIVVSDPDQTLAKAMQVIHQGAAADGTDTNAPTTFLVDGGGYVRWRYRPDTFFERLSPQELLTAVDATWSEK